jgi:[ribosomal protein S18]-alanine N-acetyltransferase
MMPSTALTVSFEKLAEANVRELADFFAAVDARYFTNATEEAARAFLAEPEDVHILGRLGGDVVAFGMLRGWHEGYAVPSLGIAVRRDLEGRGVGRAMMDALERSARERGADAIRLRVHPDNVRARRLYLARGYVDKGMERDQHLMVLTLESLP